VDFYVNSSETDLVPDLNNLGDIIAEVGQGWPGIGCAFWYFGQKGTPFPMHKEDVRSLSKKGGTPLTGGR